MAVSNLFGWTMITMDFKYSEKYWREISAINKEKNGNDLITDPARIQETLKECFQYLGSEFLKLIIQQNSASFYLFVHNIHENSIEIWKKQLEGENLTISESEFAVSRRVLKIILEQSTILELKSCKNFANEIVGKRVEYKLLLEELLYIGSQAIIISDYIAQSQLFPNSTTLQSVNDELNITTNSRYEPVFRFIETDIPKHNDEVVVINVIEEFNQVWKTEFGVDYGVLGSIVGIQKEDFKYRASFIDYKSWIAETIEKNQYDPTIVNCFYHGLTLSKENKLSFEDCILRSQDEKRYSYRPILLLCIDSKQYCLIGSNKWFESFTMLSSNSLPFGNCPHEWMQLKPIAKYLLNLNNSHDKFLEDPAIDLIKDIGFEYDRNIKSIQVKGKNNISLIKKFNTEMT